MATFYVKDPVITIGGTDYSDWCESVTITYNREDLDFTNAGSDGHKERKPGLSDGSIEVTLQQDFAASGLTQDLFAKVQADSLVAINVKPATGAISTSNPEYQGNYLASSISGIGQVGQKASHSFTWPLSGALTIDTTP